LKKPDNFCDIANSVLFELDALEHSVANLRKQPKQQRSNKTMETITKKKGRSFFQEQPLSLPLHTTL
jgi:hypothetical protein